MLKIKLFSVIEHYNKYKIKRLIEWKGNNTGHYEILSKEYDTLKEAENTIKTLEENIAIFNIKIVYNELTNEIE